MAYLSNPTTTDPKKIAAGNRQAIYDQGQQLIDQSGQQAGEAGANVNAYLNTTNDIENQMINGQGGYTPDEAAAIRGNTDSYSKFYNPDQMSQSLAGSQGRQNEAVSYLQNNLNNSIDPSQLQQSQNYRDQLNSSLQGEGQNIGGAVVNLGKNLNSAVANERTGLNAAVDPNKLGLQNADKLQLSQGFNANYLMSPEEQQRMVTGAGISAGLKDREATDAVMRNAAAAGTDPLGTAAYRARMGRQEAADAGDAMTQARIAASNTAAGRQQTAEQMRQAYAAQAEGMRLGSEQDISSRQQQNVRDVANQDVAAQEAFTNTGIGAQERVAQQQQDAATAAEQNRQAAQQYLTGAKMQSATTGGQAALQNAQLATGQTQQQNQYNTNTGTGIVQAQDTANSNRAGTIANTRIGQQNTAITNQNNKAGMFNQNQQNAYGRQQQAYGTQTSGINQSAGVSQQASQNPTTFDKVMGGVAGGLGAVASFLDDGGVVSKPTLGVVGENGPEWVGKVGQGAQGMSAGSANPKPWWQSASQMAGQVGGSIIDKIRQRNLANKLNQQGAQATMNAPPVQPPPFAPDSMANGRVVTKPTLALLGEHEPEAVVPLTKKAGAKVRPSAFRQPMYGEA